MKTPHNLPRVSKRAHGFTLIEISLVIALMLGLITLGGFSYTMVRDWNKGKTASLALQAVYSAQRSYLADRPTADIATVAPADLVPYLPTGWATMPTLQGLNGESLTLDTTVMPPVFKNGGSNYDPSKTQKDGLWDLGS
jgi:prepilin-type N-terminal cleavage/methylation domain-containing protein